MQSAEASCQKLVSISLATLSPGDTGDRKIKLHDLQLQYCVTRCNGTGGQKGPRPVSYWHAKGLGGLARGLSASCHGASQYVEAFCAMDNSKKYWLDHFVYHLCRTDEGITVAKDVVTDYRWISEVSERGSPANISRYIDHVIEMGKMLGSKMALRESMHRGRGVRESTDELPHVGSISECDVRGLREIAYVFRHEIPPDAGCPVTREVGFVECPIHPGERTIGDGGLAHRAVGRLGFVRGDNRATERGTEQSAPVGGHGVINALVHSVKMFARGPWLCPKRQCFVGTVDPRLARVIRHEGLHFCAVYSRESEDFVALGFSDGKVYLHRLANGQVANVLHEEGAGGVQSMTVSAALSSRHYQTAQIALTQLGLLWARKGALFVYGT